MRMRSCLLYSPKQNPGQIERNKVSDFVTPWNSPGQNIGVGNLYLLQWIFPAQCLLHFRRILYQLSYQGNPKQVELPELVVTDHGVCFTCNLFERQVEENLGIPKAIFLILQTEKLRSREVK